MCRCLCFCAYVCMLMCGGTGWDQKRVLDTLELILQVTKSKTAHLVFQAQQVEREDHSQVLD